MAQNEIKLSPSWINQIGGEFEKSYMKDLRAFLLSEKQMHKKTFPKGENIFEALNLTSFEDVKVVILGQDPYHNDGQAHGLSFSVPKGIAAPPSLLNIYKELERDLGFKKPSHGFLESWANQGVLLLNSVLTVRAHEAASHAGKGWENFTDEIIAKLAERNEPIVFMLWGSYAQKKGAFINSNKHLILKAPHPSPLSAHRGFIGCGHFSKANEFLKKNGRKEINWQL